MVIVGPVRPTRGGIARHTEHLTKSLSDFFDCMVLADTQLYPKFLYPGESENSKESASMEIPGATVFRSRFIKLCIRLARIERKSLAGIVLIWWTPALTPKFLLSAFVARTKRVPLIVFCHNVVPHEPSRLASSLTKLCLSVAKIFIVQTKSDATQIESWFGEKAITRVVLHPPLLGPRPPSHRKLQSRAVRFLFVGLIRPYKGVATLLEASLSWNSDDFELRIVGESWDQNLSKAILAASRDYPKRVSSLLEFIDDKTLAEEIELADYIVLPYLSVSGSGVLSLAITHGKPVILSKLPEWDGFVREGVDGFFFEPGDAGDLLRSMELASKQQNSRKLEPWKDNDSVGSWSELAETVIALTVK